MDIQLQELIDKIQKDGIDTAETEARKIRLAAKTEAEAIIAAARKQADALSIQAKQEAARFEQASVAAIEQAVRNAILAFRAELDRLLASIVRKKSVDVYDDDVLKSALPELIRNWRTGDEFDIILSPDTLTRLNGFFAQELSKELKKGLELKADRGMTAGFKIVAKDGSAYYDFSASAVADLLSSYVNPRLAELLKTAVEGK